MERGLHLSRILNSLRSFAMLRKLLLPFAMLALSSTPGAFAQDQQAEAPIRAIIAAQAAACDAGDGTAYAQDLAPGASCTNLFDMVMYGAPAFTARQRQIFASVNKVTTKHRSTRRIR